MNLGEPAAGQLLIATEPGSGGFFDRSVVLILEHNQEGTLGVCLHLPSTLDFVPPLDQFRPYLSAPAQLFVGGPVSKHAALGLALVRHPGEEPLGWRRVFDDVGILDLGTPIELVHDTYVQLRIFVGLSGWDAGQLVSELLRGSWFRTQALAEEVFATPEQLWRRVLKRIGGEAGLWSAWTQHPKHN